MKKLDLGQLLQVFGNAAVVLGILLLVYELNQNTRALQSESYQFVLDGLRAGNEILATDDEFYRIFVTGVKSPSELSDEEWERFSIFLLGRLANWEYLYLMRQENSISPVAWTAFDPGFRVMVCDPGYRRFFEEYSIRHAPAFIAYLESDVFPDCEGN